jgi:hypothetical protein
MNKQILLLLLLAQSCGAPIFAVEPDFDAIQTIVEQQAKQLGLEGGHFYVYTENPFQKQVSSPEPPRQNQKDPAALSVLRYKIKTLQAQTEKLTSQVKSLQKQLQHAKAQESSVRIVKIQPASQPETSSFELLPTPSVKRIPGGFFQAGNPKRLYQEFSPEHPIRTEILKTPAESMEMPEVLFQNTEDPPPEPEPYIPENHIIPEPEPSHALNIRRARRVSP